MKKLMLRNILAGVAVLALAASVSAQTQVPVHKAVQPKFAGSYIASTGEFVPSTQTRSGPAVIFNNMIATNYYSVPGSMQEWIDEGTLLDRSGCDQDQINGFDFIYCSSDPSATGTIGITFYDDNIRCAGPTTWPTANCGYAVSGLPMGTSTGALQCWIVFVDLMGGFECPTTIADPVFRTTGSAGLLMGWGFIPFLNNTGPWIRTGGLGADNSFTWFDTITGAFIGCFWFGGTPFASFAMKMYGNVGNSIMTYPVTPEAGDNKMLANTGNNVTYGGATETWAVSPTTAGRNYWLLANTTAGETTFTGSGGVKFSALVGVSGFLPPTPVGMPGGTLTANIPSTAPATVYVQSAETNGGLAAGNVTGMSNRVKHCK